MAVDGEKRASEVFEKFGFYLGIAVANLINTFDPEIVIIGGACAGSWDYFSERMFEQIKKRSIVEPCEVVKSELENAGVLGATVLGENI